MPSCSIGVGIGHQKSNNQTATKELEGVQMYVPLFMEITIVKYGKFTFTSMSN